MSGARLRLLGREFDAFAGAVGTHSDAWSGGSVTGEWVGLNALQRAVVDKRPDDWDLVIMPADWVPAMAAAGHIVALDDLIADAAPDGWPDAWSASFRDGVAYDGSFWGIPFHDGPQLLFTRTDLDGDAVPPTWDAMLEHARDLQARHDVAGTVLAGTPDGHNNVYDLFREIWRHGGDVITDGVVTLDSEPTRAAMAHLRDLVTTLVPANAHSLDSNGSGQAFADGEVGIVVNWSGYAAMCREGKVADRFACHVSPPAADGSPTTTVNAFWATVITTGCADVPAAWDYVRHASSAAMDIETSRAGAVGARRSTWQDPKARAEAPEYALFEAAHANSRPLPRVPALPRIVDELNLLVDAVVWRGEPMDPALAESDARIAALLRGN